MAENSRTIGEVPLAWLGNFLLLGFWVSLLAVAITIAMTIIGHMVSEVLIPWAQRNGFVAGATIAVFCMALIIMSRKNGGFF